MKNTSWLCLRLYGFDRMMNPHEQFRALSALATSNCLTEQEKKALRAHLAECGECRQAAEEYQAVAVLGMSSLASDFPAGAGRVSRGWSVEGAKQELFRRIEHGKREASTNPQESTRPVRAVQEGKQYRKWQSWLNVGQRYLPYAAGLAAVLIAGTLGYRLGAGLPAAPAPLTELRLPAHSIETSGETTSFSAERAKVQAQLDERNRALNNLNSKFARKLAELRELDSENQRLHDSLQTAENNSALAATERKELSGRLEKVQGDLTSLQQELQSLRQDHAEQALRIANLNSQLGKLPQTLKERDDTIAEQRELLSRDRDIRDLIGARDLYMAEVIDVGRDGQTKKPFGRVFYTKGKSLIFYAYDLDQQPGLREARTFQAWGRRGPDLTQATNLGIFYLDNNTPHKRWILKFDDPKSLAQIDAVFVTVEPKGGSRKPEGKQLLFAFLQVEPNHP